MTTNLERLLDVDAIPATGIDYTVETSAAEREAIAGEFRLIDLPVLEAEVTLSRPGGRTIEASGRLHARLHQPCVVTLEPVEQEIDETFRRRFVPRPAAEAPAVDIDLRPDEDAPDFYDGRRIDLGAVVLEELALAIDPYPRAPGAELPASVTGPADSATNPFAALAALRGDKRS